MVRILRHSQPKGRANRLGPPVATTPAPDPTLTALNLSNRDQQFILEDLRSFAGIMIHGEKKTCEEKAISGRERFLLGDSRYEGESVRGTKC